MDENTIQEGTEVTPEVTETPIETETVATEVEATETATVEADPVESTTETVG